MRSLKALVIVIVIGFGWGSLSSQSSTKAWIDFDTSTYDMVPNQDDDAQIIFDREYIDILPERDDQVLQFTTIHRKIKINSLYGLKQFNTLYLPTYEDLNYKVEIISCKVQVLKDDGSKIETPYSESVESSLPANVPFYYKMDGKVQMMAIEGLSIGDEVEYVYKQRRIFNSKGQYFYLPKWTSFSTDYPCKEKTLFVDAKKYTVSIFPHNFQTTGQKAKDFVYQDGYKISLKNLRSDGGNPYANSDLDQPSISYIISGYALEDNGSWKSIAYDFRANRRDARKTSIFDGDDLFTAQKEINALPTVREKMTLLLEKLNGSLENSSYVYFQIRDDIDISWSYASQVSKMMKSMFIPVDFHLVIDKNEGKLDKSNESIYQFDNIIMSVLDENGERIYLSFLEPYSVLDEIRASFQNTECFTISQNRNGTRTHSFGMIPDLKRENKIERSVRLSETDGQDGIGIMVTETVGYYGDAWMDVRPSFSFALEDSVDRDENLERFVLQGIIDNEYVDSLIHIEFENSTDQFKMTYSYISPYEMFDEGMMSKVNFNTFFDTWKYLPRQRETVKFERGYLFDEPALSFSLDVEKLSGHTWLENEALSNNFENNIGSLTSSYTINDGELHLEVLMNYLVETIEADQWNALFDVNEKFNQVIGSNLYFKAK